MSLLHVLEVSGRKSSNEREREREREREILLQWVIRLLLTNIFHRLLN